MTDAVLVLNAGSSSLKFSAFRVGSGDSRLLLRGQVEGIGTAPRIVLHSAQGKVIEDQALADGAGSDHEKALGLILDRCREQLAEIISLLSAIESSTEACGSRFRSASIPLCLLHQPHNLAPMRALQRQAPQLPQVACFDTAFHRSQPEVAQHFALPRHFTEEGVRRYGFHGLSYEYIATVLPRWDARAAAGRTVVAHLGNGASMCAMLGGKSVATTMSFTPADGLMMGTRAGSLDPGVLLYLMTRHGMNAAALERLINNESGLLGVSGISNDMRTLLESADPRAGEAIDLFIYRISRELGSLAGALGGLDALIFTGGIGENAAIIRSRACQEAQWLGVALDPAANDSAGPRISRPESAVAVWVIPTNEEWMIAEHTQQVLGLKGTTA